MSAKQQYAQHIIDEAARRPDETVRAAARRVAIDALYETRNEDGTMHDAGAAAAEAVLRIVLAELRGECATLIEIDRVRHFLRSLA